MRNHIKLYFHCRTCMSGKLAVGWTIKGLQVWCENCNKNVVSLDFLGQKIAYEKMKRGIKGKRGSAKEAKSIQHKKREAAKK